MLKYYTKSFVFTIPEDSTNARTYMRIQGIFFIVLNVIKNSCKYVFYKSYTIF